MKKKLVVLTGAGISAESGIRTFRDAGGLWEGHRIEDVASPEGWINNAQLVIDFYNKRRKQLFEVEPNAAHLLLKKLETYFDVQVITQNVDDLHERAGSTNIVHLHGKLTEVRSTRNEFDVYDIGYGELNLGDTCKNGHQLRPNIVWFGEAVPMMDEAVNVVQKADIFIVIGTSLEVYPAASLIHYVPAEKPIYIIDPNRHESLGKSYISIIQKTATEGMQDLFVHLTDENYEKE